MLKLKKSGNVTGDQRGTSKFIPFSLQDQLDGLLLADAAEKGLITPEKFVSTTTTYHGNEGNTDYDRVELVCAEGNIIVGSGLATELADWADRLGDLVFKKGENEGRTYFRLQRPGGGVSVVSTDLKIGEEEVARA